MIVLVHAAKGGVGATTVVASLALADPHRRCLLVDLAGDLGHALGVDTSRGPGVADWLASDAAPRQLDQLVVGATDTVELLPAGPTDDRSPTADERRWVALARWLVDRSAVDGSRVVIDSGTGSVGLGLVDAAEHRLLVTRRCFLALRRPTRLPADPTGVVLISEPGRSLRRLDVERALGIPIVADLSFDPSVANQVDAGLVHVARAPRSHRRGLEAIWRAIDPSSTRLAA